MPNCHIAMGHPLPSVPTLCTCPPCRQLQGAAAVHRHAGGDPDLRRGLAAYLRELQVGWGCTKKTHAMLERRPAARQLKQQSFQPPCAIAAEPTWAPLLGRY